MLAEPPWNAPDVSSEDAYDSSTTSPEGRLIDRALQRVATVFESLQVDVDIYDIRVTGEFPLTEAAVFSLEVDSSPRTWFAIADAIFPNSTEVTRAERASINAVNRRYARIVGKDPIKRRSF